ISKKVLSISKFILLPQRRGLVIKKTFAGVSNTDLIKKDLSTIMSLSRSSSLKLLVPKLVFICGFNLKLFISIYINILFRLFFNKFFYLRFYKFNFLRCFLA